MLARRVLAALVVVLATGCPAERAHPIARVAAVHATAAHGPAPVPLDPPPTGRLGDKVTPTAYALELDVDPRLPGFHGHVEIGLALAAPVSSIWLNANQLSIDHAEIRLDDGDVVRGGPIDGEIVGAKPLTSPPGLLGLALARTIPAGKATLAIDYRGTFGAHEGLFRQQYAGDWYAFTDFESTDARRALPCFDDPRFKVPWKVALDVPYEMYGFSNMPEAGVEPVGDVKRRLEFEVTRPLPSYLVAAAVGPFQQIEIGKDPVPMRVIAPGGSKATTDAMALEAGSIARLFLDAMETYTGIPVPFPKLDLVAVPEMNGAMENPGLITVHIDILLPAPPTKADLRDAMTLQSGVLAHELSHLWFGDLVTLEFWNELWLNEGFATWLSDKLAGGPAPQRVLDIADKETALALDRTTQTRVVRQDVATPDEIAGQFGSLTYRKGGQVLTMIEAFVGEDAMRTALRAYLTQHADGSATLDALAEALVQAAPERGPIAVGALTSFLDQPGVPVVEAELVCKGRKPPHVILRQSPFVALGDPAVQRTWMIPVCLGFAGGAAPICVALHDQPVDVALATSKCPAWIDPNPGEKGYYLYQLAGPALRALARAPLSPREQVGLVRDVYALLTGGRIALADWLAVDRAVLAAGDDDPLTAWLGELDAVSGIALGKARAALGKQLLAVLGKRGKAAGFATPTDESTAQRQLRLALIATRAGLGRDPALRRAGAKAAKAWLAGAEITDPNELGAMLLAAAPGGDEALFTALLDHFTGVDWPRARALSRGLGAFEDDALAARVIEKLTTGGPSHFFPLDTVDQLMRLHGELVEPSLDPMRLEDPVAVPSFRPSYRAMLAVRKALRERYAAELGKLAR